MRARRPADVVFARTSAASTATRSVAGRCSRSSVAGSSTRRSRRAVPRRVRRRRARGQRPIAEMQFNDFVATASTVVNNAAKSRIDGADRCRWSCACRGVGCDPRARITAQNTETWFYRTPGLKIVVPSTPPRCARAEASAVADPDPVCTTSTSRSIVTAHQAGARRHLPSRCRS